jgi:hypothetical protein
LARGYSLKKTLDALEFCGNFSFTGLDALVELSAGQAPGIKSAKLY